MRGGSGAPGRPANLMMPLFYAAIRDLPTADPAPGTAGAHVCLLWVRGPGGDRPPKVKTVGDWEGWGRGLEESRAKPPSLLSHFLPASPVSSVGGSPSVLPTKCPSSDIVPLLPTPPAAFPGISIRRCDGTWKPLQSPEAASKIPMWISESPY